MPSFTFFVTSACSILVPFSVSLIKWNRLKNNYLPLITLLALGLFNESVSLINVYRHIPNTINGNIFVLLDFLIVIWLFSRLQLSYSNRFLILLIMLGILVWVVDNFLLNALSGNNSLFRMVASLFIVIVSIDKLNQLLFFQNRNGNMIADMLISIGVLCYYSYKSFVESFHLFPMAIDKISFYTNLWVILGIINIGMNLLLTAAIICIPQKPAYSIRLS